MQKNKTILWRSIILNALLALFILVATSYLTGNRDARVLAADEISTPDIIGPFYPTVYNGDLRDLSQVREGEIPKQELPSPGLGEKSPLTTGSGWVDPLVQTQFGAGNMPEPIMNFEGLERSDAGGWTPPDTNGDVGPDHYIENVNIGIGIYDKTTGVELVKILFDDLFDGTGTSCDDQNRGDPIVLYDHLADRWLISDFSLPSGGPYLECIAISQTGDPVSGGWYFYALDAGNEEGSWHDYPKLSVWPDAYYMSANMFQPNMGAKVWALDRDSMLNGMGVNAVTFDLGADYWNLLPANLEGDLPPLGSPNYFAHFEFPDLLRLWEFHVDWDVIENSSLTGPIELPVAEFGFISDIPQPDPGIALDSLGDRLMMQLQYRNYGDHEAMWVNHTVPSGGVAGIRWYELRDPGDEPYIYQQGTYQPDSDYRWMGSIAADGDGNLALGYSVSSETLKPGIRYTGRLAGEPLGTLLQGEASLIEGSGVQTSSNRWGDYSAMTIDSDDDCTFWYTQEYYTVDGGNWQTRIGSFRFPSCGVPKGWIEGVVYDAESEQGIPGALVVAQSVTTTLTVETNATGYYTMTLPGETYTLTAGPLAPSYPEPMVIENVVVIAGETTQLDILLNPKPALVEDYLIIDDAPPYGNGNGYAEPGERQIILTEAIANVGPITATNVTAQLIALTSGVTLTVDSASYPDIPPGASQINLTDFVFSISSDIPCGAQLDFMKLLSTDQGPFTVTFSIYASEPLPMETLFFDDMESGPDNWTTGGEHDRWEITDELSKSLTHSWSDSPSSPYANNANSWLQAPIIDLSGKRDFILSFWHQYAMETGWDFTYVEYSLDGGTTWEAPLDSYTGFLNTWTQESFAIPAFDDQPNASFRFRLQSDVSVTEDGWYIDDVDLSYIPFQCTFTPLDPPDIPILVSPLDGAVVINPVTFEWAPAQLGGPVEGYIFALDSTSLITFTTPVTNTTLMLDPGEHNWSVAAFNISGTSAFASEWMLEVPFRMYLPLTSND
jgi:hypothetical protein